MRSAYWLGPWHWDREGFWRAPDGAVAVLDLRSPEQCGLREQPAGVGLFAGNLGSDYLRVGDLAQTLKPRHVARLAGLLGISPLVSRTLPQINIIAVGFGLNSLMTLALLILSIGAVAWTFQGPVPDILLELQQATGTAPQLP